MTDPRLNRIPHLDERSRAFRAVTPRLASLRSRSYTWRVMTAPVLDQGREGACVGFGWSAELAARPMEVGDVDNNFALRLYWQAQGVDRAEGRHFDEGATLLAGAKAVQRMGRIQGYRWSFGLDEVIQTLAYLGPVVLGIPWYESMYEAPDGVVSVGGQVAGGHCILARAVSLSRQAVMLRNSWGPDWGIGGDAWVSFADLDKLLRDQGEACLPQGRR